MQGRAQGLTEDNSALGLECLRGAGGPKGEGEAQREWENQERERLTE